MILLLAVIIPRKYDVHAVTCLHILHCFKTTVLVSSLVSLLVLVLLMILTTWCREWTNSNIVWLWWLYIQTNRVQLCIACYYISHDTWLSCATCTWFSNSRCAVNMKPRISVLQVSKSVSQCICIRRRNRVKTSQQCQAVENRCVFSARMKAFYDSS